MRANDYFYLILPLLVFKVIGLILISISGNDFFGGANDSDYYHSFATGKEDVAVNFWPVILRWLNEIGFYSRGIITFILTILGVIVIPALVGRLSSVQFSPNKTRCFCASFLIISCYPTLTYYTTDIYREIFMLFLWLIGLFFLKRMSVCRNGWLYFLILTVGLLYSYALYLFRPYLGFGFLASIIFSSFYDFRRWPLGISFLAFLGILQICYEVGVIEPILQYRKIFGDQVVGGSDFGIQFASSSTFLLDFFKSFSYQMLGLYFVNASSLVVFLIESVPFALMLAYVLKNRQFSDKFVTYLMIFFVCYSFVWILGNDNLGTAVRLRMFSYISVVIAFFIVYQRKMIAKSHNDFF